MKPRMPNVFARHVLPVVLLLVGSLHAVADAQSTTDTSEAQRSAPATVSGRVLDPSGAVIGGASLSLRRTDAGAERSVSSGPDGAFEIANLQPGSYHLSVSAAGFTTMTRDVDAPSANVDVVLQVAGGVAEVLVRGELERTTSSGKLPLSVRDTVQTVEIIPRAVIEERGVTTVNDAVETAVGVQPIVGYGGMDAAGIVSRGFANDWVLVMGFGCSGTAYPSTW